MAHCFPCVVHSCDCSPATLLQLVDWLLWHNENAQPFAWLGADWGERGGITARELALWITLQVIWCCMLCSGCARCGTGCLTLRIALQVTGVATAAAALCTLCYGCAAPLPPSFSPSLSWLTLSLTP